MGRKPWATLTEQEREPWMKSVLMTPGTAWKVKGLEAGAAGLEAVFRGLINLGKQADEAAAQIEQLKAAGHSNREIARRIGVSETSVRKLLGRLGWREPSVEPGLLPLPAEGNDLFDQFLPPPGQGGGVDVLAMIVVKLAGPDQAFLLEAVQPLLDVLERFPRGPVRILRHFAGQLELGERASAQPAQNDQLVLAKDFEGLENHGALSLLETAPRFSR
jgi:hypothetical protein